MAKDCLLPHNVCTQGSRLRYKPSPDMQSMETFRAIHATRLWMAGLALGPPMMPFCNQLRRAIASRTAIEKLTCSTAWPRTTKTLEHAGAWVTPSSRRNPPGRPCVPALAQVFEHPISCAWRQQILSFGRWCPDDYCKDEAIDFKCLL